MKCFRFKKKNVVMLAPSDFHGGHHASKISWYYTFIPTVKVEPLEPLEPDSNAD